MKLKGTLIGGVTGFILTGNPYAIALGAVAGYMFEKEVIPAVKLSADKKEFLDKLAVLIAGFNHAVYRDPKLWATFLKSYGRYFKMDSYQIQYLIHSLKAEMNAVSGPKLNATLKQLSYSQLTTRQKETITGLFYLFISGQKNITKSMEEYCRKIIAWLDVTEKEIGILKKKWSFQSLGSYEALKSSPMDSLEKIKKRYTGEIKQYHPDTVSDPEEKKQVEMRAKELNSHWDHIRRYHQVWERKE